MSIRTALMEMAKPKTERASWVPEAILDDDVADFMGAAAAAKKAGKKEFEFGGKKYKVTMKDKTADAIEERVKEALDDKDTDTVKAVVKALKGASKAHAGQAKQLKKDLEDSKVHEKVEIGGITYQHMDLCPAAVKQFKSDLEKGDNPKVRAAMKAVDAYLGIEAAAKEKGSASQADVDKMEAMIATAKEKISDAGLSGHDYHQAHLDTVKDMMSKEKVDEAAAAGSTAQHGPDTATSDSYDKQLATRGGEKDFADKHTTEVAYDAEELYKENQKEATAALKRTPGRLGDQTKGDTSFVSPLKAEIIDGITAALAKMKTNS